MIKMSEYHIPFHIQEEIMKRLPVKSLVQCRCVSKAWKSLIESSDFIVAHSLRRHTQHQHLVVWHSNQVEEVHYGSYIDDHTFPQNRSLLTLPLSIKQLKDARVVGISHGLLCLCGFDPQMETNIAILWNPSVRKYIGVVVPLPGEPCVGFGVCPVTSDPKIVTITKSWEFEHCEVMIYTLSTGKWKSSSNLPTEPKLHRQPSVVTDRFMYWIAGSTPNMIMSFDVTNEKFKLVDLPGSLASNPSWYILIFKLGESLAVLEENRENSCTIVWMMEDGVESFQKVFTIQAPQNMIVGFRKSGIPIMVVYDYEGHEWCACVVYEPNSEHSTVIDMSRSRLHKLNTNYYMESLLCFDRSDFYSY